MLTPAELAAHYRVSTRQVQRWRAAGMPCVPVGARAVRYDPAQCEVWLRAAHSAQECPANPHQPAAGKSLSASAASAYTAAYRRAHLRVMPSAAKPS
jgi:phage terminase Nu1 subunit (DNA packaging protein)